MTSTRFVCLFVILGSAMLAAQSNPVPLINQPLVPDSVAPGGQGFVLAVNGTGFVSGAVVNWNGSPRATQFVSSSQVTADVSASDIQSSGTASITVLNPNPGGGISNALFFGIGPSISSVLVSSSAFGTGTFPSSVITGDFNHDGLLDLAIADAALDSKTGYVSILLGKGDGTFEANVDYPAGGTPVWVVSGDFNGDGKQDLAVANSQDGTVSIFLGNGDGTFQSAVAYAVGGEPMSIAVGDFNGDGRLDLAVSNWVSQNVSILLGNGDGTFQTHVDYPAGKNPSCVAIGDLNGDGKLDLAVADFTRDNNVSILLGNGDGTFGAPVSYSTGLGPYAIAIADLNADGILDLAVVNAEDSTISILLGKGDATFQQHVDYPTAIGAAAIAIGDLNDDGMLDLVTANSTSNSISVLLGNGDGTFQPHVDFSSGKKDIGIAVGDFNQDGYLDFAAVNELDYTVSILTEAIPAVTLSPNALTFPNQVVFTSSPAQPVTLTNTGLGTLLISKISVTGPFGQTNNCPSSIGPGANCTISVKFHPLTKGVLHGAVSVTDNAPASPQKVPLTGTGTFVQLIPAKLNFGSQPVGTKSLAKKITLTNKGSSAVKITDIAITGTDARDFAETNTCGESVASGASCFIKVTFEPLAKGKRTADVSVYDNGGGSPQQAMLIGTGT